MRRRARSVAAASVALFALLLTGCVVIPTSGGVIAGDRLADEDAPASVLLPQGPEPGADQQAILQGFLRAGTGPRGDWSVAREFLAGPLRSDWDPVAGVIISQTGSESYSQSGEDIIEYSTVPLASVDGSGRYTEAVSAAPQTKRFAFTRVDGEWRITQAPDGIVVPASAFTLIFERYGLQFFDPTYRFAVPDERWFPSTSVGVLSRRVARALIEGPAEWLAGAVENAFPPGTRLGDAGVRVEANRATVDLSAEASDAGPVELERMRLQLELSLTQIASIGAVSITVGGAAVATDGGVAPPVVQPEVDPRVLLLEDGVFGAVQQGQLQPLDGISAALAALAPSAITYAGATGTAAALNAAGVWGVTPDGARLLDNRAGLAEPSLDGFGFVWSAPAGEPAALQAYSTDGTAHALASALPERARLRAFEVSRDDARIALLLEVDGESRLHVAGIIRDDGVPVALGAFTAVPTGAVQVIDIAWVDAESIATIALADARYRVTRHVIGGTSESFGQLGFATRIVGGNGVDGLRVLGESGTIYQPQGTGWQATSLTAQVLATRR